MCTIKKSTPNEFCHNKSEPVSKVLQWNISYYISLEFLFFAAFEAVAKNSFELEIKNFPIGRNVKFFDFVNLLHFDGAINQWSLVTRHDKIFIFCDFMTDNRWNVRNKVELYSGYNTEPGYWSLKTCHFEPNFGNVKNLT